MLDLPDWSYALITLLIFAVPLIGYAVNLDKDEKQRQE
jgi:type VI protein secretion system component VasF